MSESALSSGHAGVEGGRPAAAVRLRRAQVGLAIALLSMGAGPVTAHPLAPALLQLRELGEGRVEVAWKTSKQRLPGARVRPVLPPDCRRSGRPVAREEARSVTTTWILDCGDAPLVGRTVGVDGLAGARIDALLRVELADGRRVQGVLNASDSRLVIPARPSRLDVFRGYLRLGFEHILSGPDHLLFVFGLLLLVGGLRPLIQTVTAFTLGHSVTLALAALGIVRFPSQPIELCIALSVFVLAVELAREPGDHWIRRAPWRMAVLFGLLHGLGFAGALAEVGLPEDEVPLALLAFNVGIELGQLAFVLGLLLLWRLLRGRLPEVPPWLRAVPVYAMGSLAALWCIERAVPLLRF